MKKFSEIEYTRPDFQKTKAEVLDLLDNISSASSAELQIGLIYKFYELVADFNAYTNIASIRFTLDTRDEFYAAEKEWLNSTLPEFSLLSGEFYKIIVKSSFRPDLEKEFGTQLFTIADFKILKIDERIVEDRKRENRLVTEYSKLAASAKIPWEGEQLNLIQLLPYKVSEDRAIRKKAADATFKFLSDNSKDFDRIFDELTHLRDGMAKKIGLNSYVDLGYVQMMRSDYTSEMVSAFRKKIEEYIVPLVETLRLKQSNRIGLDHLKHFDEGFKFKSGNPKPLGDSAIVVKNTKKMFKELSPETDTFFEFMTKYELMDLDARKGKKMGGYCTYISKFKTPFIFSNSNGTSNDIRVLIHEAGHCFQKYESAHFKVSEYYWPTKESAEIHSMSMELFTHPWMNIFFGNDAEKFKFKHLAETITHLPHGVAVDEFQHRVYEKPEMTPKERNAVWRSIEKKYKPNLDYDGNKFAESGGRWHQQMHIYASPFYYIDYALAQICALQFWVRMQNDFEGAWADYLKLCKAGGSMSFLKLIQSAGLKSPFEEGVIEEVATKVEIYLNNVDDTQF